ncbi:ATP-binding cassette domain-containing protein [Zooshikella ganghwensis]|uniref:ATP-binding cassette domain-containing protein n=1 Tax=Zooshikella ganghwensis TaxID=202772 RepID=A0A4P9VTY6_9GAMM|nr:ATP-binding cassette domain-containing protein [Zooshikella ganghwensis]RDH46656.1 ATP-binding cassette domain-containing protein [Zooshikella ganghwensis]
MQVDSTLKAAVELRNISLSFDNQPLFKNLYFELPTEKITAIVGVSGCGKSTLLKLINGLVPPDDGEIHICGQQVSHSDQADWRRYMGYAVQQIGLFPHLNAADNVILLAQLEQWSSLSIQERLDYLADKMGLDQAILSRFPHELSGGQAQRVGLCRAMMLKPPILLLDEAFSAVDPITRMDIYQYFLRLQETEPRTVLLITHDMREAVKLSDYIAVMQQGEIVQFAPVEQVVSQPATDYVARLVKEHI